MTYRQAKWRGWLLAVVFLAASLCGCTSAKQPAEADIVILFTNDVHCAVEENIGYAGLAAYKEKMLQETPYVTLVDCGDAWQGEMIGTVSQGAYPVDIMNRVGYDFAVLGNHEFDYGMQQLTVLLEQANAQYLGCNLRYTGDGENALSAVQPYAIVSYGETQVAYIGVSTPESLVKSTPAYFMNAQGDFVYDFYGQEQGNALYECVQETVKCCQEEGADYIVALTHLGTDESSAPFRSIDLIANTNGIDAVLDGHSHSVIPCQFVENKEGTDVLLSSTGTGLNYIGQLTITSSGNLLTSLISDYPKVDEEVRTYIDDVQHRFEADMDRVVAHSEATLSTFSEEGIRLVRNRETNIGDFCADAYRAVGKADVALVNGGGIRADLPAGDITYGDILAVHPYGNTLCVVEVTGQAILDALEMASRFTLAQADDGKNAVGENGAFLQVSGLKYTIRPSIASTVEVDENGMFVSCGSARRVQDVQVQAEDGTYAPLDPLKIYTVASHNYLIKQGGDGMTMFMDCPLIVDEGMVDYQILITYIRETLDGSIGAAYQEPQDRITVEG